MEHKTCEWVRARAGRESILRVRSMYPTMDIGRLCTYILVQGSLYPVSSIDDG